MPRSIGIVEYPRMDEKGLSGTKSEEAMNVLLD